MAVQGTLRDNVITLKNGTGEDAIPYRVYEIDTTEKQFKKVSGEGGSQIGVLLPNLDYEDQVTGDGDEGSLQISGITDIDCDGSVSVGDYVKANDENGKVTSAGVLSDMSDISAPMEITGRSTEEGDDSRIAVILNPQILPKTT
ncbi:MAG: hypothetical protein ACOC5T_06660 [Elusimicrobiota bacterium]